MDRSTQARIAEALRARHCAPPILLLPNAWDALSAYVFASQGFEALATTSGGVAWALGYPDGEVAPWSEVVAATRRIVRVAGVPVTADIESGYASDLPELEDHVAEIVDCGVVGVNLEDSLRGSLRGLDEAVARLEAARRAALRVGVPIVINARCDVYHTPDGAAETAFATALERCKAYVAAGADCVYPFGLREIGTIGRLVEELKAPVNVTGRPDMPSAADLERLGVARVTLASAPALVAMGALQALARDLRTRGSFERLESELRRDPLQKFFKEVGK